MDFRALIATCHESDDYDELIEQIPYAKMLGMRCQRLGDDALFILPKNRDNIGNPTLPAIHGGVIAGFMEHSSLLHLWMFMDVPSLPKIIDFSIDYLRAGLYQDTFVECQVCRQGRRVANVSIIAWQTSRDKPIATARAHFKLED